MLSLMGVMFIIVFGAAWTDSGQDAPLFAATVAHVLAGTLLQPLAYWVLREAFVNWGTGTGVLALAGLLLLNSGLAVASGALLLRLFRRDRTVEGRAGRDQGGADH